MTGVAREAARPVSRRLRVRAEIEAERPVRVRLICRAAPTHRERVLALFRDLRHFRAVFQAAFPVNAFVVYGPRKNVTLLDDGSVEVRLTLGLIELTAA